GDVLTAAALTIPLALVAALAPAWEAASVAPVEAARGGGTRASASRLRVLVAAALACLAAGFALTRLDAIDGKPVFGFAAELLLLLGGAMLTPLALAGACRAVAWCYASFALPARAELRLATANLLGSLGRVSVSVAALAVALSMMMAIAIMVGSFRTTVTYWLESALSADLAVKPVMQSSAVSESRMSPRAVEIIRGDPGVEEALWVTTRQTPVGDRTIRLAVTELGKALPQTSLLFKRPPPPGLVASGEWDAHVLVSESYQLLFGADVGDAITLPTAAGPAEMTIAGVYFDYSSNQGAVLMDLAAYRRLYSASDPNPMPQSLSIRLKEGANPVTVRTRIVSQLGPDEQLYCVTNDEIRTEAMRIFESTFTVTYALQAIAIVVAGLGVASTLVTLIYERQRELGLMSLVGATARQVRRVVLFEAVILGAASQAVGILLGVVLAAVLVFVINVQSFGWTIQFHLPWAFFGVASLLVIGASALFGLYPAVRAASVNPLETVREL
ncbi:MAG: FtsX-like permease family protein, partial [Planctomycetota bacterium]